MRNDSKQQTNLDNNTEDTYYSYKLRAENLVHAMLIQVQLRVLEKLSDMFIRLGVYFLDVWTDVLMKYRVADSTVGVGEESEDEDYSS